MDLENIGREVLQKLEQGWNDGDGARFAEPFADDADFVDIRGQHHRGQEAIAAGHHGIFQSVYRGSQIKYALTHIRALTDDVALMHSTGNLSAPSGPMAGQHEARQTIVLKREGDGWKIASFHNTVVAPMAPRP